MPRPRVLDFAVSRRWFYESTRALKRDTCIIPLHKSGDSLGTAYFLILYFSIVKLLRSLVSSNALQISSLCTHSLDLSTGPGRMRRGGPARPAHPARSAAGCCADSPPMIEHIMAHRIDQPECQPEIHAKCIWPEYSGLGPNKDGRLDLQGTTHLGFFSENENYDSAFVSICQRIRSSSPVFTVKSGSIQYGDRKHVTSAWTTNHIYKSNLLLEHL